MNISDIFIIYLACGAPFGVSFFLHNRKSYKAPQLWLKSFLTVFVWIPYAFFILNDFAAKKNRNKESARRNLLDAEINFIRNQLLQILLKSKNNVSIFELREVLDRYAGLTLACQSYNPAPNEYEKEIFRLSLRQNAQLASNCLHRRNIQRLRFHQILARKNFLEIISVLKFSCSDVETLRISALDFVNILDDKDALKLLEALFTKTLPSDSNFPVNNSEKEVWKSKGQKTLPASILPNRLRTFSAPTMFRKD